MSDDTPTRGKWTWCRETNKLIPYEEVKVEVDAPFVLTDEIPGGMMSMANRQIYTSKAKYRRHLRREGFVEVGDEKLKPITKLPEDPQYERQLEEDAARTYYELRDGNNPYLTEADRERCRQTDHSLSHYNYDRREYDEFGNLRK